MEREERLHTTCLLWVAVAQVLRLFKGSESSGRDLMLGILLMWGKEH